MGTPILLSPRAILEQRPACAAVLGAIVAQWSVAESLLAAQFSGLIFGKIPDEDNVPIGVTIVLQTFEMIVNVGQKKSTLLAAAKLREPGDELITKYRELLDDLHAADKGRNRAAHGRWGVSDRFPDSIIYSLRITEPHKAQAFDVNDLNDDLTKIIAASEALWNFYALTLTPKCKFVSEFPVS